MNPAADIETSGSQPDQTLLATQFHHARLNSVADMKANLLLTMSSVVLTICLLQLLNNHRLWPLYILIAFCLLTICLATYVVMPKSPPADLPASGLRDPQLMALFSGDFTRLSRAEFEDAMNQLRNDPNQTDAELVRAICLQGILLAQKKLRILRLGYLSFMAGLVSATVCFVIESLF